MMNFVANMIFQNRNCMRECEKIINIINQRKMLYHEDFFCKSQEELIQMSHVDLFRYRCKEAIIQKMIPYRQIDNTGCQSEACKTLMSLAKQIEDNTELMANALVYGYGGEFSKIIYDEIGEALQSYCGVSIDDVLDSLRIK